MYTINIFVESTAHVSVQAKVLVSEMIEITLHSRQQ